MTSVGGRGCRTPRCTRRCSPSPPPGWRSPRRWTSSFFRLAKNDSIGGVVPAVPTPAHAARDPLLRQHAAGSARWRTGSRDPSEPPDPRRPLETTRTAPSPTHPPPAGWSSSRPSPSPPPCRLNRSSTDGQVQPPLAGRDVRHVRDPRRIRLRPGRTARSSTFSATGRAWFESVVCTELPLRLRGDPGLAHDSGHRVHAARRRPGPPTRRASAGCRTAPSPRRGSPSPRSVNSSRRASAALAPAYRQA